VSKAFTRESDEAGEQETSSVRPQLPAGMRNYITRDGADGLRRRLGALLETRRASGPDPVASPDRRRLESVIRKLQAILDSVVIAGSPGDQETAAFGASVSIRHENGEEDEYQIVGVDEADPQAGRISWISPLARVLLSRKAGDKVPFRSPAGSEELTIVKVHYPPAKR
jgi:transcription elongation factor GreB